MVQNIYLNEIAKAAGGVSHTIPGWLAVGTTQITSIDTQATSLPGEVGTRVELNTTVAQNVTGYDAIRQSIQVPVIEGQPIYWVALFPTDTGGIPYVATILPGLTQTTNFDLEFDYDVTFRRP